MNNAEKFKQLFGLYATELWSKPEKDFLTWLNMEYVPDTNVGELISIQDAIDALESKVRYTDHDEPVVDWNDLVAALVSLPSVQPNLQPTCNQLATDCISRQAAIDEIRKCRFVVDAIEKIKDLPAAEPRKGKWIRTRTMTHDGELYCDQCEQEHPEQKIIWNFCPNCGADMRDKHDE